MNVTFQVTKYHTAIASACQQERCVVVNAGPGSGKTTTIQMVVVPNLLKHHRKGGAIAFNTKNAYDLKNAINLLNVDCSTEHSALFKCLKKVVPSIKVEVETPAGYNKFRKRWMPATVDKVAQIAAIMVASAKEDAPEAPVVSLALKLVSLMKMSALGLAGFPAISDRTAINEIVDAHGLSPEGDSDAVDGDSGDILDESISLAISLVNASNKASGACNFDDMIYLALHLNAPLPDWDFLVYDEGQDLKPVSLEFLRRMHAKGCQIVVVGDTNQAINQFAGSMHMALETAIVQLDALSLPLPVSYRCSKAAALLANGVFESAVIANDSALDGDHIEWDMAQFSDNIDAFDNGHGVLSRTHKNLMPIALKFLAAKKSFVYKGVAELIQRMERMLWHASKESDDLGTIRKNLTEYQQHLEDTKVKPSGALPAWVMVNGETTEALCLLLAYVQGEQGTLASVKGYLKTLGDSANAVNGPTLSTLHSSKGMQWPNVYLLGNLQSPLAKTEQQLHAEKCLEFVAYSRSSDKVITIAV
jgi:superfamily I DNA/RNA helicase